MDQSLLSADPRPTALAPGFAWIGSLLAVLDEAVRDRDGEPLEVLEAGGGSATVLATFSRPLHFVTIDISEEQLARNAYAAEKIHADLATVDLGDRRFDLVVCFEHVAQPGRVADKLLSATRPGGLAIFKGPLPKSAKGILTRLTPRWVHVLVYRHLFRIRTAGLPGHPPFPTFLARECDLNFLTALCERHGFAVVAVAEFESDQIHKIRSGFPLIFRLFAGLSALCNFRKSRPLGPHLV